MTIGSPSSRIIVKNLPKWTTEERLRKHFSSKGQLTDVKLMYTRSGVFRRFAYLGFVSADEAAAALKYFDKTFIDTSRISVEFAHQLGSEELQRPWSKYSKGSSSHEAYLKAKAAKEAATNRPGKNAQADKAEDRLKAEVERKKKLLQSIYGEMAEEDGDADAGRLKAFVAASKPASKTKLWENDTEDVLTMGKKPVKTQVKAVPNKKPGGQGQLVTKVHVKFDETDGEVDSQLIDEGAESDDLYEDLVPARLPLEAVESVLSPGPQDDDEHDHDHDHDHDNDHDNHHDNHHDNDHDHGNDDDDDKDKGKDKDHAPKLVAEPSTVEDVSQGAVARAEPSAELIADTGRLFVRNLSYSCTEGELKQLFEPFGPLSEVHLSISRESKKPKGFAYVLFMFPEHALRAYTALDGTIFMGRLLHILPAHERPASRAAGDKDESTSGSFRLNKERELKENAQKDYNWNSLFIRGDTVLDAIAAKLGVAKSAIMDIHGSDNLATRLAVAETNLIHETKTYLESEGVVLDSFVSGAERSDVVILVKNLPWDTETAEIRRLFDKFGSLGRVILPPTKAVALVEFFEASEARIAFKSLAYSRFKNAPLFLEWAPVKSLRPIERPQPSQDQAIVRITEDPTEREGLEIDQSVLDAVTTLYVKNLNFSTTSDTLKTVFSAVGPIRSAKVATKKTGDRVLSLGFGFVEFERKESLNRALDELQGHIVDGHALFLKKSTSGADSDANLRQARRKKQSETAALDDAQNEQATKLLVRNIPFEASEKEVRELFKSFAQLKRLRLPRRYDGRHRGFGFVDFLTHQEAVNAKAALSHTHLYGRHLVLEWAKPEASEEDDKDDQLEMLRAKTRKRMNVSSMGRTPSGRGKKLLRLSDPTEETQLRDGGPSEDEEEDDE